MANTKRVCKVCGQPIHYSKAHGWGWIHSIAENHDHLPVPKEEVKSIQNKTK